ncbi:hypothetical protein [Streptomyces sp. Inha503]|uniref:hypothetical protein n=1 Tax=Streptomyces sp. Inha503 TaxID=3383314 RepID=UPI0039A3191A
MTVPAPTTSARATGWVLRSAVAADIEVIAELRATVMRTDLERLGRYVTGPVRPYLTLPSAASPVRISAI